MTSAARAIHQRTWIAKPTPPRIRTISKATSIASIALPALRSLADESFRSSQLPGYRRRNIAMVSAAREEAPEQFLAVGQDPEDRDRRGGPTWPTYTSSNPASR